MDGGLERQGVATIDDRRTEGQQKQIHVLTAQLRKQSALIRRVSDQREMKTATSFAVQ
jgi:hypothetical protein